MNSKYFTSTVVNAKSRGNSTQITRINRRFTQIFFCANPYHLRTKFLNCFAGLLLLLLISCGQPSGALRFETITVEDRVKLPNATEEHHGMKYSVNFTHPTGYSDKAVLGKLQQQFIHHSLGEKYVRSASGAKLTPKKAVEALIADWTAEYNEMLKENAEYAGDVGFLQMATWDLACSNAVLFENDALLQLQSKGDYYRGGAHGHYVTSCRLFNLTTGDEYSRSDVFKSDADESIRRLIIAELSRVTDGFERNGVWNENTNFAVTSEGIMIAYSDYELGSYAVGNAQITVPYAKILPFLREGTPVWEVANNTAGTTRADTQQQEVYVEPPLDGQAFHEALIQAIQTDDHPAFDRLLSQVTDIDLMIPFAEPPSIELRIENEKARRFDG